MPEEARLTIKLEDEGVPQAPGRIPGQAPVEPGGIRPTAGVAIPPPSALPPKPPDPPEPPSLLPEPLPPSSKPPEPPDQHEGFVRTFAQAGVSAIGPGVAAGVGAATQSGTAGALAGTAAGGAAQMLMGAGPIGLALGGAAAGAVILVEAFKGLTRWVNTVTDEIEQFSGPVAQAAAQAEVRELRVSIARAKELGPMMAEFVEVQSEIKEMFSKVMTEVLKVVIPILTEIFEFLKKVYVEFLKVMAHMDKAIGDALDLANPFVNEMAERAKKLEKRLEWIANLLRDQVPGDIISPEVRAFLDPDQFQEPFGMVPVPKRGAANNPLIPGIGIAFF